MSITVEWFRCTAILERYRLLPARTSEPSILWTLKFWYNSTRLGEMRGRGSARTSSCFLQDLQEVANATGAPASHTSRHSESKSEPLRKRRFVLAGNSRYVAFRSFQMRKSFPFSASKFFAIGQSKSRWCL